jgi:hypothetical protein
LAEERDISPAIISLLSPDGSERRLGVRNMARSIASRQTRTSRG